MFKRANRDLDEIFGSTFLFSALLLTPASASDDHLPSNMIGRWGANVSYGASCYSPSLIGEVDGDAVVGVADDGLHYPDMGCKTLSTTALDDTGRAFKVNLSSSGEGYHWKGQLTLRLQAINGEAFLLAAGGPDEEVAAYRRCR